MTRTRKEKLKNVEMAARVEQLKPLLARKDRIGYFAARNSRLLMNELTEYYSFRDNLIRKYGAPGEKKGTIALEVGGENWDSFRAEMDEFDNIEHEIEFYICGFEDAVDRLTGEEILAIDWMLAD